MRTARAQIKTTDGRAIIGKPGNRPHAEHLVQRHAAMKDVTAGQKELFLEIDGGQNLAVQNRPFYIWRVLGKQIQASVGIGLTLMLPAQSLGKIVWPILRKNVHDV